MLCNCQKKLWTVDIPCMVGGQRRRAGGNESLHPNWPFPVVRAIPGCNTDGADWVIACFRYVYTEATAEQRAVSDRQKSGEKVEEKRGNEKERWQRDTTKVSHEKKITTAVPVKSMWQKYLIQFTTVMHYSNFRSTLKNMLTETIC